MTKKDLIDLLNEDLKNEYKHMIFYLRSSVIVRGLHRQSIQAFLAGEAQAEMAHVTEFSKQVRSLGGVPGVEVNPIPVLEDPQAILEYALEMESEVVDNYAKRIEQAAELGGVDGISIRMFYERQLEDSRGDLIELREMIAGFDR